MAKAKPTDETTGLLPQSEPVGEELMPHKIYLSSAVSKEDDSTIFKRFVETVMMRPTIEKDGLIWFQWGKGWTYCRFERKEQYLLCYRKIFPKEPHP